MWSGQCWRPDQRCQSQSSMVSCPHEPCAVPLPAETLFPGLIAETLVSAELGVGRWHPLMSAGSSAGGSALRGTRPQAGQRRNSVALGGCSKMWPQLPGPWPLLSNQVDPWAGPRGRMSCDCPASMTPFSNQQAYFRAAMACTLDFSTWGERDSEQGQGRDLGDHKGPFLLEGKNSPRGLSEPFGLTSGNPRIVPRSGQATGPRPPVGYKVLRPSCPAII